MATTKRKNKAELLQAQLVSKNAALVKYEDKILQLSDEIKHKSVSLKQKRASEKSVRVAQSRIVAHMKSYETDLKNRPSDRSDDIRMYTKMDLDVWKYPQVREWFNSMASSEDFGYHLTPSQTGYMIKIDDDYKGGPSR